MQISGARVFVHKHLVHHDFLSALRMCGFVMTPPPLQLGQHSCMAERRKPLVHAARRDDGHAHVRSRFGVGVEKEDEEAIFPFAKRFVVMSLEMMMDGAAQIYQAHESKL
jgi:hypothetical protein